jgi:multidrug efflux pump subunit AcrA (membrane-fusion protein)
MTGSITITTNRVDNALVVPSRAIRRVGRNSTVTVKKEDGSTETRNVTAGTTNGTLTQILSGLQDGEQVLVSTPTTSTSATGNRPTTTGGFGGGGLPGGGPVVIPGGR